MVQPPSGTVTFLLTDVEASTEAWETDAAQARTAVRQQEEIIAAAVADQGGFRPVEQGEGDSVVAAFARASDAVAAALAAQLALTQDERRAGAPVRVRMALHTGEADAHGGRYAGPAIIRAARLRAAAHGGQIVLSRAAAEVAADELPPGATLVDLGTHRLRDLVRAEHVFQLSHPELPGGFPPLRSLDRIANNLPVQLTSFIGRDDELAQVSALLSQVRLLTLTGAGGCGKTRLAAHAAALVADSYPAGVWWADLAALRTGSAVSAAVLSAVGLREHPARTAVDQLAAHLDSGPALLITDNCEHVLDDVVALVQPLLARAPRLVVLATSREPLAVPGETTWRVPPLALPAAAAATPAVEALGAYDAIALFVERARQARPNFAVTNENAPAVAEICASLDGIPLAIELAAARVRVLSPEQIRAGLDDRFRLLTAPATRTGTRHQTLSASVEWSYDLLNDGERRLLHRLAVFAGGFTLDAAESVCGGDGLDTLEILDLLTGLVDKSLVGADDGRSTTRYRLLETIRQFAAARLISPGGGVQPEGLRASHAAFFRRLAAEAEDRFLSDDALTGQLEAEHDNCRAALDWALSRDDAEAAVDLLLGLAHLWLARGLLREAAAWFDRVLRHPAVAESPARHRAVWARGLMAVIDGRPDPALAMADDVAEWARSAGDARYICRALIVAGVVRMMADPVAGQPVLADAVEKGDATGDPISSVLGRITLLVSAIHQDDHDLVARQLAEGEAVFRSGSGQMQAMYHALAGWSDVRVGRLDSARRHAAAAAALANRFGDAVLAGALFVLLQALIELAAGRTEDAATLLEPVLREPRSAGPTREDAMLTGAWGWVLAIRGRITEAEPAMAEGVRLAEEIGDGLQVAFCLSWHAGVLRLAGDLVRARAVAQSLLAHASAQHNPAFEAVALRELAAVAALDGDLDLADDLAHRALVLSARCGLAPDVATGLAYVASVAGAEDSWEEAARLFAASQALRDRIGVVLAPWDEPLVGPVLDRVRAGLDDESFHAAWNQGRALSVEEAIAYAERGRGERKRPTTGWASLTPMERQVVDLLSIGLRNAEIAERLFIAPSTVKTHLGHAFTKLGVSTRAELAVLAAARKP